MIECELSDNKNKTACATSCFIANFAVLISILWPLKSSGSLFSNLNGSMIWISFCFLNLFYRYFKNKKHNIYIN